MKEYLKRINGENRNEYYNRLKNDIENSKRQFIITVNPEILMSAAKDEEVDKMLLDESVSLIPDGIAVVKACLMNGFQVKERIAGVEIAEFLISELDRQKKTLYLFGAKNDVVEALCEKIKKEYPNVKIAGCSHGFTEDKDKIFDEIALCSPDVCLVALGVPAQEKLIYKNIGRFDKGIFVGVGGSFDVLSGKKKRAPEFFIKHDLEWLYRILREPSRLRRFYNNNIKFLYKVKKEK